MIIKVGTFNLNNLFSRFNFKATISAKKSNALSVRYEFSNETDYRIRTYNGKLIKAKKHRDTEAIATRILSMDLDVLAVQEVENIDILKEFNSKHLHGLYPYRVLLEGNDPRLINVGLLSKLPLAAISSFQTAVHPDRPNAKVFSRDLLEVQVLNSNRSQMLFTLYNNHLKSHFGDDNSNGQGKQKNDLRRRQQAEAINQIISARMRTNSRFLVVGDMNDAPDTNALSALLNIEGKQMLNALANAKETRPAKKESSGHDPLSKAWTHRYKKSNQPPEHKLFDQIWLSPALAKKFSAAYIDRRTKHGGNGSDHDPAWVELEF